MSGYTLRPLSDRTWLRPPGKRKTSPFSAKWSDTRALLLSEIQRLGGRDLVIELDVVEGDFRLDGDLRAKAAFQSPAVRVSFESRIHGPMMHPCDTYLGSSYKAGPGWQHNVRAVALTLQALRAVDRYGAADTGQQYQGFRAIGGGTAMPGPKPPMSSGAAAELLRSYADPGAPIANAWRRAVRATHPDAGGDRAAFDRVQEAARVLGLSR